MTKTLLLRATLALGGGSSLLSRQMLAGIANSVIDGMWRWGGVSWFVGSVAVFLAAAFLLRRFGGAPLIVLLIGAAAFVVEHALDVFLTVLFQYGRPGTAFIPAAVGPCYGPDPAFEIAKHISFLVGSICFPVGFLWFALRAARASNQTMQLTPSRPESTFPND